MTEKPTAVTITIQATKPVRKAVDNVRLRGRRAPNTMAPALASRRIGTTL